MLKYKQGSLEVRVKSEIESLICNSKQRKFNFAKKMVILQDTICRYIIIQNNNAIQMEIKSNLVPGFNLHIL